MKTAHRCRCESRPADIAGMAHSPFLFWDGRKDSLWAQALGPLESPVEHGGSREQYAKVIAAHYRPDYETIFGPMPALTTRDEATTVFVNMARRSPLTNERSSPGLRDSTVMSRPWRIPATRLRACCRPTRWLACGSLSAKRAA
jgi:hypothetical protein